MHDNHTHKMYNAKNSKNIHCTSYAAAQPQLKKLFRIFTSICSHGCCVKSDGRHFEHLLFEISRSLSSMIHVVGLFS